MSLDFQVKLGQSTSLLTGYKADIYSVPFTTSNKPALFEKEVVVKNPDYDARWSSPVITLHHNVEDLLSAVLQVKLRPMRFEDQPSEGGAPSTWPAGALTLAGLSNIERQEALQHLSTQLGIDLSKEGCSYALARCTRKVGTATHLCYERGIFGNPDPDNTLKPDALDGLKKLEKLQKTSTDVSMNGAKGYLNFYETYGSHFVSSIAAGDSIFQVFAFGAPAFESIRKSYEKHPEDFRGDLSFSFSIFTVPRSKDGRFGYAAAAGNICIASEDDEMEKSLKDGLWRDESYSGTNSIFAPHDRTDAIDINTTFKKVVPISVELASVSAFAEYYRMLIWHRIFKAAMYVKYANGSGVAPYLSNNCPYDLDTVFQDSDPIGGDGLLSTLCTPSVNIMQEKIDLSAIVVRFPGVVKEFAVFANAIQIPSSLPKENTSIDVPGSRDVTLLGHVITSGEKGPLPPNIQLTDSAFEGIKNRLFCGEFYGALRISNSDNSKSYVIMNGLMLEYTDGHVTVVRDVRDSPSSKVVIERLTDIQFALVAAEARLQFLLANPTNHEKSIELMKHFLLWLAEVAGSDDELVPLQARAMYLANVAASTQQSGIPVPLLRYEAYKDVVQNVQDVIKTASDKLTNFQNQIRARMAEEREIDREQALNENIIKSGQLLQDYIVSQATYQESLENMFQSVFEGKEEEMNKVVNETKKLQSRLNEQRAVVDQAIVDYKDAVAEWQKEETLKAAIDIASAIFSLGSALVTPASSFESLKTLGETVQKIQKLAAVFDAVIKVYQALEELPKDPQEVVDALKNVGPEGLVTPSSLEWDEMHVQFEAVLSTGPDVQAKTTLSAAFEILVLRGKALLESQSVIQKIAADLAGAQQRITLHHDQKKRLDELKINLDAKPEDLDAEKIDLIGLSGQLLFFQRQMLMILASTVIIQDRALQYEYLRQPTPVGSFTMMGLQLAILRQSQSINQGLTVQPPPQNQEYPIIYEIHGVRAESITNNRRYTFNIDINKREFGPFNYVRVESVAVEVDGIVSTESGKYYTELVFDGDPFFDRGFNGETLTFQTTSRIFTGLQKVKSSGKDDEPNVAEASHAYESTTGQDPFGGKISSITPFSKWHVSLPQTLSNEGIMFGDRIIIRLTFRIYAQLKETKMSPLELYNRSYQYLVRPTLIPAAPPLSFDASPATSFSVTDVLTMMNKDSVCAGWDVVFSMTAKQINEQLKVQYSDRQGNPKFLRETGIHSSEGVTADHKKFKRTFEFKFNAPKLQFLLNNSNTAGVYLPIISGHWASYYWVGESWERFNHYDVKEGDGASILGNVGLASVAGSVSSQHNVAIKLKGGHFEPKNFKVDVSSPVVTAVLTDYFAKLGEGYEVYNFGTLDFKQISVLKSLQPSNFLFHVLHTPSNRDLLQLFIATTGKLQSSAQMDLREPVPSGYECSLIVSSKIFFEDVLPKSLGKTASGLVLEEVAPGSDLNKDKTWSSKATAGSVSCSLPETRVDSGTTEGGQWEDYVKVSNDTVVVDLSGMKFQRGEVDYVNSRCDVKMVYDVNKSYPFQYGERQRIFTIIGSGDWSAVYYKDYSVPVTITMNAKLPLEVTGSGQNQMVRFAATTSQVIPNGHLSPPGGACKSSDRKMQEEFIGTLKRELPPKLTNIFNQKFESVSLFALKNLLFPAKNLFDMKEAFVPGDMVVFGNFTSANTQK